MAVILNDCLRRRRRLPLATIATLMLCGCADIDVRPANWAFIAPTVLATNCATASCHSKGAAAAGLDLSDADAAYKSLLQQSAQFYLPVKPEQDTATCKGERGGTVCVTPRPLVQPCRPNESRIVNMMRGRGAQLMPPDRPLPVADIELIERWILAGAKQRPNDPLPSCDLPPPPDAAAGDIDAAVVTPTNPDAAPATNVDADGGVG